MEDWIAIRAMARQGVSLSEIGRPTGRDPKTIRKVLREPGPRERATTWRRDQRKLAPYEAQLLARIEQGCLNASVLCEEITRLGYTGKITRVRDFVRPIRREIVRSREATERFETGPGKQAQVDWGHFGRIWNAPSERWEKLYAFVFTLGYSRAQFLEFVTCCDLEHFLACHLHACAALGIPEQILYDNLKTAVIGRHLDGTPQFQTGFADFALSHGYTPKLCQPYRARTQGKVERGIGYVRQNFWVRVSAAITTREVDLSALNARAQDWVATVAHVRVHGTHGEVVAKRLALAQPTLGSLHARPQYEVAYRSTRRVGRDGRLSYRGQLYQVALSAALTEVTLVETLEGQVRVQTSTGSTLALEPITRAVAQRPPPADGGTETTPAPASETPPSPPILPPDLVAPVVQLRPLSVSQEVLDAAGDA